MSSPTTGARRAAAVVAALAALSFVSGHVAAAQTQPTRAAAAALAPDLSRTLDAEVRVAMFEMAAGNELAALSRLERMSALAAADSTGAGAPERAALHFLLSQSYYRLGMLAPFRREAEAALAAGQTRYASVLRPQLVVEAYRSGDYARAATTAREIPASDANGVAALVAGLASYQTNDLAAARSSFQRAATASGEVGAYARYMDALATLRGDTAQAAGAVAALEAAAGAASGEFAAQARLTAAQVAYEGERYGDAVRLASTVDASSRLAAPALLTRAWALYKLEQVAEAEQAFSTFADRFPGRPERDEALLMAAQAQLELGRPADAERIFQRVADSSAVEVAALQAQTNAVMSDVARALVAGRVADLLVTGDPVSAKALVLQDSTSSATAMASIMGGQSAGPTGVMLSTSGAATSRLDSVVARTSPAVTRVIFAPASATTQPRQLAERSQALTGADAAVSVARYRLAEQLEAQQREIALLTRLAALLDADSAGVAAVAAEYQAVADSLARLDQMMATAETKLRELLGREIEATRSLAAENARTADSLRTALAAGVVTGDREALEAEVATATAYSRLAEAASSGLANAIAHHPAFVMRDSIRAHGTRTRTLLAELQGSYGASRRDLASALSALRGGDGPATRAARQALTEAEGRRTSLEGEVIAAVTSELSARAGEMVAGLQRGVEAAQFGSASAAFFRAIEGTRTIGTVDGAAAGRTASSRQEQRQDAPREKSPERRR